METVDKTTRYENPWFDYEKFARELDAIRKHKRLENGSQLAQAIGVHPDCIRRLSTGQGVAFAQLCQIVLWSNLDLRDYLSEPAASAKPLGAMPRHDQMD